jgi:hypothetical protein
MSLDSSRSGDRYGTLPKSFRVTFRLSDNAFAIPKSSTFTCPDEVMRMFRGFRSLWCSEVSVRPPIVAVKACAASRNRHSSIAIWTARSRANGFASTSERLIPSTYSIAM